MRFGVAIFPLRMEQMRDVTVEAERLGFDSVWLGEHVVAPVEFRSLYPHPDTAPEGVPPFHAGIPFYDPYAAFGYLAAFTETISFVNGVSILPLHDPFHLARSITTIDHIAPGRFSLGIGTGWLREEYEILGRDFDRRGVRLDETLDVMERLWSDDIATFEGECFQLPPSRFEPKLRSGKPKYVFGGHSGRALRRTARRGDGWFGVELSPPSVAATVDRLRQLRAEHGVAGELEISVLLGLPESRLDSDGSALVKRLPPAVVDDYAAAGVDRVVVRPWRKGRDALRNLQHVAQALGVGS